MRRLRYAAFLAVVCFLPWRTWAWGCDGHETVAIIAEAHLTPHARAMATRILKKSPIGPNLKRYCNQEGLDPLANSSTWADDYRTLHPETDDWHFIDIPRGAPKGDIEKYCRPPNGCITHSLKEQIQILRTSGDAARQADALRFILHLLGDIHQPLHTITNDDRGGNCVPVNFFDQLTMLKDAEHESYSPNLHNIWDALIVERRKGARTVQQLASVLDQRFGNQAAEWRKAGIEIDEWAWESHELAETIAYGDLPRAIPVEKPQAVHSCADDNNIGSKMFALHEAVAERYQSETAPAVERQLEKAGVRLAMVLNEVWK